MIYIIFAQIEVFISLLRAVFIDAIERLGTILHDPNIVISRISKSSNIYMVESHFHYEYSQIFYFLILLYASIFV